VSLFALIFSIGILVDDAIVVVENIHRHQQLDPGKTLAQIIPGAVDEVGGPTILATLHRDRRAAAHGLCQRADGPVHEPHPHQRQHGHAAVAGDCLRGHALAGAAVDETAPRPHTSKEAGGMAWRGAHAAVSRASSRRCSMTRRGGATASLLGLARGGADRAVGGAAGAGLVLLKMLPFDNKSEFQVVVDMPAGTPVERTAAVLHELGAYLATVPEVTDYQAYAGTAAPINFNGLVRQYYLRSGGEVGDLQVNLVDKHAAQGAEPRHRHARAPGAAADRRSATAPTSRWWKCRPARRCCRPSWPKSTAPTREGRRQWRKAVRQVFERSTDRRGRRGRQQHCRAPRSCCWSTGARPRCWACRSRPSWRTLRAGLAGEAATYLHDASKYPAPVCCSCRRAPGRPGRAAAAAGARRHRASWCPCASWSP
jgi:hypothetical protein